MAVRATCTGSQVERTEELLSRLCSSTCPARCLVCASVLFHLEQNVSADSLRHRLNGYLAKWVPSPPGKHAFKNFTIQTRPKTACKKRLGTRWAKYPFSRCRVWPLVSLGPRRSGCFPRENWAGSVTASRRAASEDACYPEPAPRGTVRKEKNVRGGLRLALCASGS